MSTETTIDEQTVELLYRALLKLQIFAGRPTVQIQVVVLLLCLFLATLIFRYATSHIGIALRALNNRTRNRIHNPERFIYISTRSLTFPIAALILTDILRRLLTAQGIVTGIIGQFSWVLTTVLGFQCLIAMLYLIVETDEVRRYHYRLFLPLLVMALFLKSINDLVNLQELAGVVLTTVFGNPLTVGALFVATFGLYFWNDTVHGLQDLLYKLITHYTAADQGATKASLTLLRYILIVAGILYALSQLQLDATTLAAISGGLSVGVGFGLREILSNFVSSLLLLFERSLHPGDVVEVDGELTVVENFSIRATTVRTLNNVELVIPNQTFFTASFKTYTGSDRTVRVPIFLKTDCEIDPRNVMRVLQDAALTHTEVLKHPQPSVFLLEYADNVAAFQLNIWLDNPVISPRVSSEVKLLVWDAFGRHGIALPFPETEVHFSNRQPLQMAGSSPEALTLTTQGALMN